MPQLRIVTLLVAAAIATGSTLAVTLPSQAAVINQIGSTEGNKCLQPANASLGAVIVQETCNGSVAQQWTQQPSPYYGSADWFVNRSSGLCLDVRGGDTNGVPVEQWTCDRISNELWKFWIPVGSKLPYGQLVSDVKPYTKDKCLSAPGQANGDAMVLYSDTPATPAEFWSLSPS